MADVPRLVRSERRGKEAAEDLRCSAVTGQTPRGKGVFRMRAWRANVRLKSLRSVRTSGGASSAGAESSSLPSLGSGDSTPPDQPPFERARALFDRGGARVVCLLLVALVLFAWGVFEVFLAGGRFASLLEGLPVLGDRFVGKLAADGLDADVAFRRLVAVALLLLVTAFGGLVVRPRMFRDYFTAVTHPLNLAVFRIVIFFVLANIRYVEQAITMSALPSVFLVPPEGLEFILPHVPISPGIVRPLAAVYVIACLMAMIGLYTRTSATVAVLLGIYVLGIVQFYGKVGHFHHVLWFGAIMAASPCADVLSVDAVRRAWRRAPAGADTPIAPAKGYALPLRLTWLVLSLLYFFPGFGKFVRSGTAWAFSDNLKLLMYGRWRQAGEVPFFRIDQYPEMYQMAAASTILFELMFPVLLFIPMLRLPLAASGLIFHNLSGIFMRLGFTLLQPVYVSFVNWHRLLSAAGSRLFRAPLTLAYEPGCVECRRITAVSRRLDLLQVVKYLEEPGSGQHIDRADLRALIARVPLLVTLIPALVKDSVRRVVREHSTYRQAPQPAPSAPHPSRRSVVIVGGGIFVAVLLAGLAGLNSGWPFASYPQFAQLSTEFRTVVGAELIRPDGTVLQLATEVPAEELTGRYGGLTDGILNSETEELRRRRLEALLTLLQDEGLRVEPGDEVVFYADQVSVVPERWNENPLSREMLYVYTVR